MELLAPAKNLEGGIIAVNCGADAVYIGAPQFGARNQAANSLKDIFSLIAYAHKYTARVYAALNTVIFDSELEEAFELARVLTEEGIDGLIIQDMAFAEAGLKNTKFIASTQLHNFDLNKINFLEKVGFSRVILARELSQEKLSNIKANTKDIELEVFVHGALCTGQSGRCFLSLSMGHRSSNRGSCAQPCRLPWLLKNSTRVLADGHLLSLKDLCRLNQLEKLVELGITSFKIEGRLKNEKYVANVVRQYRLSLDKILEKRGIAPICSDLYENDFVPDLHVTFNRGYVEEYSRSLKMATFDTPKMKGELLGKVISVKENKLLIESDIPVRAKDGICFFVKKKLMGTAITKAQKNEVFVLDSTGIAKGTILYRNVNSQVKKRINTAVKRKVPVFIKCGINEQHINILIKDNMGNSTSILREYKFEKAQNAEASINSLKQQFNKTNDTEFKVIDIEFSVELLNGQMPYLTKAWINKLRRDAVALLQQGRVESIKSGQNKNLIPVEYHDSYLDYTHNILNKAARAFYKKCGVTTIEDCPDSGMNLQGRAVMFSNYCLQNELNLCKNKKSKSGKEQLILSSSKGYEYALDFDCDKCVMKLIFIKDFKMKK